MTSHDIWFPDHTHEIIFISNIWRFPESWGYPQGYLPFSYRIFHSSHYINHPAIGLGYHQLWKPPSRKIPIPEIPELASDLSGDTMVYLALWKIWVRQWERLIIPYIFIYYYGKIKNIWNHQHNSSMLHVVKEVTTLIKSCKNGSCATIRTHKTHGLQSQFSQWSKLS